MKKYIWIFTFAFIVFSFFGCKKFLNVVPIDNLAGNNFWKTNSDFDGYTLGLYSDFRQVTMIDEMFFVATGDFRCAPVNNTSTYYYEYFINDLRKNDLATMLARYEYNETGANRRPIWKITLWDGFYSIVQKANILYYETEISTILSESAKTKYKSEAVFMRCLCYFFMVRVYGDIPYYTEAFHSDPLPRMPMVDVLKKCIADLSGVKNDLPWTYEDPNVVGTRANRGAAIDLLMHMNMWLAGFDHATSPETYYRQTANLGKEIMDDNEGAYSLVPLDQTSSIFKGHSKESLFEIVQNYNTNENFNSSAVYSTYSLLKPFTSSESAYFYYDQAFMTKLYPRDTTSDGRRDAWFDDNMYNADGTQEMSKFIDTTQKGGLDISTRNDQIVFRYTDAVLLRAEALSDLSSDDSARAIVNLIRTRAKANPFNSSGKQLNDDIYWERVRELMGEGYYFYDLVRTHKLTDGNYCFVPLTGPQFNAGGWTWPLDITALDNNPLISLNPYWQ